MSSGSEISKADVFDVTPSGVGDLQSESCYMSGAYQGSCHCVIAAKQEQAEQIGKE